MQKSTKLKQKLDLQCKPGLQKAGSPTQAGCPPGANLKKIHYYSDIIASAINKMDGTRRRKAYAIKLKNGSD